MKMRRVRFQLVPLLMMSLLAVSCAIPHSVQTTPVEPLPPGGAGRFFLDNFITITSPQGGQSWYTGYRAPITWICYTHANRRIPPSFDPSCLTDDISIWQGGNRIKQLSGGADSIINWDIPYVDPAGVDLAGAFEIRVNNVYTQFGDPKLKLTLIPGLEGRQTFTIVPSTITVDTPSQTLVINTVSKITWSYTGYPPSFDIYLVPTSGAAAELIGQNALRGTNGKGSFDWIVKASSVPANSSASFYYRMTTPNKVWSTSNPFNIASPP